MKKLVHMDKWDSKNVICQNPKKRILEKKKARRDKRTCREIKEENIIQIHYNRIKITITITY